MQAWSYEINDVLLITHKGAEVLARVVGYEDSLDNTTALYMNLRTAKGLRWSASEIKVMPKQIIKYIPPWKEDEALLGKD